MSTPLMMNLHRKIAEAVIAQATTTQSPLAGMLEGKDPQQACHVIFSSYRGGSDQAKGMRLSDEGLQLLKAFFKCHDVYLVPGYKQTLPHILYMDRVAKMPYWMNDKYCAMFDSELAMMLRLAEGRIQDLVDSRFRLTSSGGSLTPDF
jgi:hypothetical protein